jgi:uncharacterized ferritin-like protein (DUF455 family)
MFTYPSHLKEINARDLQSHIEMHAIPENVALLHALAHIEFNAFSAYTDTYYRFRSGVPDSIRNEFEVDVTAVALEEGHHFTLLQQRLSELGHPYGRLPVITGLTRNISETADNVIDRLIIISLVQEGKGLDASPRLLAKIKQLGDKKSEPILKLIAEEEVGHVAFGAKWVRRIC